MIRMGITVVVTVNNGYNKGGGGCDDDEDGFKEEANVLFGI